MFSVEWNKECDRVLKVRVVIEVGVVGEVDCDLGFDIRVKKGCRVIFSREESRVKVRYFSVFFGISAWVRVDEEGSFGKK